MSKRKYELVSDVAFVAAVLFPVLAPQLLDVTIDPADTAAVGGALHWALELLIAGPLMAQRMLGEIEHGFWLLCGAPMMLTATGALALRLSADFGVKARWAVWSIVVARHVGWAMAAGGVGAYLAGPAGWALSAAPLAVWATFAWAIEAITSTRERFFEGLCAMFALEHLLWPGALTLWLLFI